MIFIYKIFNKYSFTSNKIQWKWLFNHYNCNNTYLNWKYNNFKEEKLFNPTCTLWAPYEQYGMQTNSQNILTHCTHMVYSNSVLIICRFNMIYCDINFKKKLAKINVLLHKLCISFHVTFSLLYNWAVLTADWRSSSQWRHNCVESFLYLPPSCSLAKCRPFKKKMKRIGPLEVF